jgi:hypothetical protein
LDFKHDIKVRKYELKSIHELRGDVEEKWGIKIKGLLTTLSYKIGSGKADGKEVIQKQFYHTRCITLHKISAVLNHV